MTFKRSMVRSRSAPPFFFNHFRVIEAFRKLPDFPSILSHLRFSISPFLHPVFKAVITMGFKLGSHLLISPLHSSFDRYLNRLLFSGNILTFLRRFMVSSSTMSHSTAFVNMCIMVASSLLTVAGVFPFVISFILAFKFSTFFIGQQSSLL